MVELLSPAGNFISLRAVLENGADATYFGLDDFNMRANAKNFSLNDLSEVSKIAKQYSAKTENTPPDELSKRTSLSMHFTPSILYDKLELRVLLP